MLRKAMLSIMRYRSGEKHASSTDDPDRAFTAPGKTAVAGPMSQRLSCATYEEWLC